MLAFPVATEALPQQVYQLNTIINHQYVTNTDSTKEIIEAIKQRADVTDSAVLTTERNLAKQMEDTARKHHHSPSSYRSPIQDGKKLFHDTFYIDATYFRSNFDKVKHAG